MAEECEGCKPTILNKQTSRIADPLCNDCGELEVQCSGEYIYTECVKSNVALDCIDTAIGATQTAINQAIVDKLCETINDNCGVQIDVNDTCCGNLESKLVAGDGIVVTKNIATATAGCKTLTISEKCWEWNDVGIGSANGNFKNKWTNADANAEVAQYSNEKECAIRLNGLITNTSYDATKGLIFILPSGKRPLKDRVFSVTVTESLSGNILPGFIRIYSATGNVVLLYNPSTSATITIVTTLENIQFNID